MKKRVLYSLQKEKCFKSPYQFKEDLNKKWKFTNFDGHLQTL